MYESELIKIATKTIIDYDMIQKNDHIVVGVSGGADSVALLLFLCNIKKKYNLQLTVCHINHCLRGEDSDNDEKFVLNLCEKLGVACDVLRFSADIEAQENHIGIEEYSRKKRYDFFKAHCGGNDKIATAHNLNDSIETVIFNMTRGTATKGLCGIPYKRENIIRPLRDCSRDIIEDFVVNNGYNYCTDKTNFEDIYNRNKIRLNVIPELMKINGNLLNTVNRMSTQLYSQYKMVEELARKTLENSMIAENTNNTDICYNRKALIDNYDCINFEIIKQIADNIGIEVSEKKLGLLHKMFIDGNGTLQLSKKYTIKIDAKYVYIKKIKEPYQHFKQEIILPKVNEEVKYNILDSKFIKISNLGEICKENNKKIHNKDLTNYIKCDRMITSLFIEQVSDKDEIYRQGREHKLTYLYRLGTKGFSDFHISKMFVIKDIDNNILWAEKFGVNEKTVNNYVKKNIYLIKVLEE